MSFITFSPPGRNPLPGLIRVARQSFDWTGRLVAGICRNTISLLLGGTLAALCGVGAVGGFVAVMVASAPDDAVTRLFPHSHVVAEAPHAYSQGPADRGSRNWFRRDRPDPAGDLRAERLVAFGLSVAGFYGAYRSGNRLGKWWKGEGKFPLAPKVKTALQFSGYALLALLVGLMGVDLIGSSVETLTGNDASVLAHSTPDPFDRTLPTIEFARSGAIWAFCSGEALIGGFTVFAGWCCFRLVKGLRSLFRPAQSN